MKIENFVGMKNCYFKIMFAGLVSFSDLTYAAKELRTLALTLNNEKVVIQRAFLQNIRNLTK